VVSQIDRFSASRRISVFSALKDKLNAEGAVNAENRREEF